MYKYWFCICLISLLSCVVYSQDRKALELERKSALYDIEQTNKILQSNQKSQKQSLNKLNAVSSQIKARQKLLTSINNEVAILNSTINNNQKKIATLEKRIKDIKKDYADNLQTMYTNRITDNVLAYLFTSDNFSQAYRRKIYFDQYVNHSKSQIDTAMMLTTEINSINDSLKIQKLEKDSLLALHKKEMTELNNQSKSYNATLKSLSKKESELRKELKQKQQIADRLQKEIQNLIQQEVKKSGSNKSGGEGAKLSQVDVALSKEFGENKGKLPWPVDQGFISSTFGVHQHPVLKVMLPTNNGIDITVPSGSVAKAVFNGEVSRVVAIPGANYTIIIRHGNYLTVYQNLVNIAVKQGQNVKMGQSLGNIYTDQSDNTTVLHFELWKESEKYNPENWLKRRL